MKEYKRVLLAVLMLLTSSFLIVSCEDDVVEEEINVELQEAAALPAGDGPDAPDTPDELMFEAYYTWIRCGSDNAPPTGIAELKAYFQSEEQCRCLTWKWEVENCAEGPGSQMTYARCEKRLTSRRPYGALCDW